MSCNELDTHILNPPRVNASKTDSGAGNDATSGYAQAAQDGVGALDQPRWSTNKIAMSCAVVLGKTCIEQLVVEDAHGAAPPPGRVLHDVVNGQVEGLCHARELLAMGNGIVGRDAVNQGQCAIVVFGHERTQVTQHRTDAGATSNVHSRHRLVIRDKMSMWAVEIDPGSSGQIADAVGEITLFLDCKTNGRIIG